MRVMKGQRQVGCLLEGLYTFMLVHVLVYNLSWYNVMLHTAANTANCWALISLSPPLSHDLP